MKRSDNIILIGLRGAGKTSIGRLLARMTGLSFLDLDEAMAEENGMDANASLQTKGEDWFRQEEKRILALHEGARGFIIATGGGVVLSLENRTRLKKMGWVVWLKANVETLCERIDGSERPPLTTLPCIDEMASLLKERAPLYESITDLSFNTELETKEEIATRILALLEIEKEKPKR